MLATRKPTLQTLLLIALLLRIALSPFAFHVDSSFTGDIATWIPVTRAFLQGHTPTDADLLYPPLTYYTMTFWIGYVLRGLLPTSFLELSIRGTQAQLAWMSSPYVFRYAFLLKLLHLLPEAVTVYLIWRMFRHDQRQARLALIFWLFNPIIIHNAYLHGQFDTLPLLFIVLALYLARQQRPLGAAFFIGVAACFKNYPFFFLLPAIIILSRSLKDRVILFLVGTVPYVLLLLPYITKYTPSVSGYGDWFFKVGYDLGFGGRVYIFFALYAALLWYLHHCQAHTFEDLWESCLAILLVYYSLSYFDLHYWAWIMPFAAIYFAERPREATPFYLVILACLLVLTAPTPLARFFAAISPRFFLRLPTLMEALNPYLPMLFLTNVVRSLLAGTCFYLAWRLLRNMPASRSGPVEAAPSTAATL